ncbi:hypothetical protein EVA_17210 [gut metagenome]|uniref:Uncharacterized protein n=1 Tax=gut metagenome TaxID=749906 RepID=J9FJT9_9ZZZZ
MSLMNPMHKNVSSRLPHQTCLSLLNYQVPPKSWTYHRTKNRWGEIASRWESFLHIQMNHAPCHRKGHPTHPLQHYQQLQQADVTYISFLRKTA